MEKLKSNVKIQKTLTSDACAIPQSDADVILSNVPRSYPTPVKMFEESTKRHVACGRWFDTSMLLHEVNQCDYCGRVQPGHVDPCFPSNVPYDRKHLTNAYHSVWHCACDACKGSQLYPTRKPTVMDYYKRYHKNQAPWQFLKCDQSSGNATI